MDELIQEVIAKAKELGKKSEQTRIMREMLEVRDEIPQAVRALMMKIINPK